MRATIYRSENLHVFSVYPQPGATDLVVICFQNRADNLSLDSPGFGEGFLAKEGIAGIFVNCRSNVWWQYEDLPSCLAAIRFAASDFARRVAYGSSMGGYAAIRFADVIAANAVISACPQYSPRRQIVSLENRYESDVIDTHFIHESELGQFADIPRYLLFDPFLAVDKAQANRYLDHGSVVMLPMPAAGHPCLPMLMEQGILTEVLKSMFDGTFCAARFMANQHKRRRSTYRYHDQLSYRLAERRKLRTASRAAEECARLFVGKKDEALSLAARWALYAGDHIRAGLLTARVTADYPAVVKLWADAQAGRQKALRI